MQIGEGVLSYPLPWATEPAISSLASPDQYRQAMVEGGFTVVSETNRREFALAFFDGVRKRVEVNGGPPPIGLHTLIGETTAVKFQNMIPQIVAGHIAPVEMIAHKQ